MDGSTEKIGLLLLKKEQWLLGSCHCNVEGTTDRRNGGRAKRIKEKEPSSTTMKYSGF